MTELTLSAIVSRRNRAKSDEFNVLTDRYLARSGHYLPTQSMNFEDEEAFFAWTSKGTGRAAAHAILFDPRGKTLTSDEFAQSLGRLRDDGAQRIVLAIGPADGWSDAARGRVAALVSFGRITLPHELARLVAAEQIYRALTILAGHPYHCGH
jgi:23S rRNA (pseudouridine1915-N3)-methyltransferase